MSNVTKATVVVGLPTTRKDGTTVSPADIKHIRVYRAVGAAALALLGTFDPTAASLSYDDTTIVAGAVYNYAVSGVDENGVEGDVSPGFPVQVPMPEGALSAPTIISITFS